MVTIILLTMRRIAATLAVVALLFSAGSAWADFDDGIAAAQRGDYATAFQEWRPLALQGVAEAQFNLGVMRYEGWNVSTDYEISRRFKCQSTSRQCSRCHRSAPLCKSGRL